MLKKTLRNQMKQNNQSLIYKTPNVKKNKERNPYLTSLEDGEKKMKKVKEHPSPSFAPHQILINSSLEWNS